MVNLRRRFAGLATAILGVAAPAFSFFMEHTPQDVQNSFKLWTDVDLGAWITDMSLGMLIIWTVSALLILIGVCLCFWPTRRTVAAENSPVNEGVAMANDQYNFFGGNNHVGNITNNYNEPPQRHLDETLKHEILRGVSVEKSIDLSVEAGSPEAEAFAREVGTMLLQAGYQVAFRSGLQARSVPGITLVDYGSVIRIHIGPNDGTTILKM